MDNYLVSARKYRPDTFMSVVGQKALTTTLQNAIKNKQLAHAYLFCGPRGVGKTTCARIFAKAINCMNLQPNGEACNECESCRSFEEQRSYNIHELDAASNNSVDDIRELTDQVRIPPQVGKYKVYIIDEVHMLSQGAFNAFLKTLEEPPAHAIFILATTEKHKIIPTILSRCQIYDFHRISVNDIQEYLKYVAQSEQIPYEPEALNVIAMKADGGMRDALSIFDQVVSFGEGKITYKNVIENLNVLDYDYYFRLVDMFLNHRASETLLLFDEILNQGFEGQHFILGLCSHLRDLMVCKDARTLKLLEVGDSIRDNYQKQASVCSFEFLFSSLKIANECSLQYNQSKNKRLLVELCLLRLCQGGGTDPQNNPPLQPIKQDKTTGTSGSSTSSLSSSSNTGASISNSVNSSAPISSISDTKAAATETPKASVENTPNATAPQTGTTTSSTDAITPEKAVPQPSPEKAVKEKVIKSPPKTLSLKIKKSDTENEEKIEINITPQDIENEPFNDNDLAQSWSDLIQTLPEDPLLKATVTGSTPKLINDTDFEFVVPNAYSESQLNHIRPQIEGFLRKSLHNGHIQMKLRISVGNEIKKALTQKDQLNAMIEKNPALGLLRQKLKLDLE